MENHPEMVIDSINQSITRALGPSISICNLNFSQLWAIYFCILSINDAPTTNRNEKKITRSGNSVSFIGRRKALVKWLGIYHLCWDVFSTASHVRAGLYSKSNKHLRGLQETWADVYEDIHKNRLEKSKFWVSVESYVSSAYSIPFWVMRFQESIISEPFEESL